MKKIKSILLLSAVSMTVLLLTSWSTPKSSSPQSLVDNNLLLDNPNAVFVVYKDGKVVQYQSLKFVKGVFTSPHLLADGKVKINPSEILAFQNENHYAVSQSQIADGRKSSVALETLPGFAVRLIKGRLNLYCKKYYNGYVAVNEYFVQLGQDGKIQKYSPELMESIIQDDPEACDYFSKKINNLHKLDLLQSTVSMYNKTVALNETFASSSR